MLRTFYKWWQKKEGTGLASQNKASQHFPRDFSSKDRHNASPGMVLREQDRGPSIYPLCYNHKTNTKHSHHLLETYNLPHTGLSLLRSLSCCASTWCYRGMVLPFMFCSWGNRGRPLHVDVEDPGGAGHFLFLKLFIYAWLICPQKRMGVHCPHEWGSRLSR